jgi:hypothetical protein
MCVGATIRSARAGEGGRASARLAARAVPSALLGATGRGERAEVRVGQRHRHVRQLAQLLSEPREACALVAHAVQPKQARRVVSARGRECAPAEVAPDVAALVEQHRKAEGGDEAGGHHVRRFLLGVEPLGHVLLALVRDAVEAHDEDAGHGERLDRRNRVAPPDAADHAEDHAAPAATPLRLPG